ncbi:hypothetical protein SAY87_006094 [Trapa incisa]|uniref:Receptor-like serine/threonine-protein kinase n=1 Tax=Trapa incisa TaxID=236973 RepID=A0AAN7K6Z1_9MYRT|nr:hypothetical protein SAY87_006094 [Trapa incisa]
MALFLLLSFSFLFLLSTAPPSAAQTQSFKSLNVSNSPWRATQGSLLLSNNSVFAAGFLPSSQGLYKFSIWYHNISADNVVWSVKAQLGSSATLSITNTSELILTNGSSPGGNLWPKNFNASSQSSAQLVLDDYGNLTFSISTADLWGSFQDPTDTFLPQQNMSGTILISSNGRFSFDSEYLIFNKTEKYWNSTNPFVILIESGEIRQKNGGNPVYSADLSDVWFRRVKLGDDGNLRIYSYRPTLNQWTIVWQSITELCTIHGTCGPNSICRTDGEGSTYCVCPPGFRPTSYDNYDCERKILLSNTSNTKFIQLDYVNFTGGSNQSNVGPTNLSDCRARCLAKSNCLGFMFKYDGTGWCVLQLDRLLYGYWSPGSAANAMFLRVDISETDNNTNFTGLTSLIETTCPVNLTLPEPPEDSNSTTRNIIIVCTIFVAELLSGVAFFWAFLKKYIKYRTMAQTLGLELIPAGGPKKFAYADVKAATNGFSNPIGKGGFGDVYKGELSDKRAVAVKCLKSVAGGDSEFWAEVTIIARMHHLNLVRLWGFCAEKGERILIYEYVPNGSLDKYLFRSDRSQTDGEEDKPVLDWNIRYRIAVGVARAIAYLHEECLEWVLHCDIKPENILLGDDFCPKISDFGLAKLRKKEDMVSLSRVRGTRGYMAPEWVKADQITPKADVYSFGMVLLEIVSGIRNFDVQGITGESAEWYFPGWAFDKVFKEMKIEDILDRHIRHAYDDRAHFERVDRMVKTAMWCLQDQPELRPSMGKVAKMLEGTVEIMEPKKPTLYYLQDQ